MYTDMYPNYMGKSMLKSVDNITPYTPKVFPTPNDDIEVVRVNISEISHVLDSLKIYHDKPISALDVKHRKIFDQLVKAICSLYDTSSYDELYQLIQDKFRDIVPIPGTIGAYCTGCKKRGDGSVNTVCSHVFTDSGIKDDSHMCQQNVILAIYTNDGFRITPLKKAETNNDTAYIFCNFSSIEDFPGFSESEKKVLNNLGITNIYLNGYTSATEYVELINKAVSLDHIKLRISNTISHKIQFSDVNSKITIILTIVMLIALAIFYWKHVYIQT